MKRTNKIKARKMWATADYADATNDSQNGGVEYEIGKVAPMDLPVSVLPRTKEAAEAMASTLETAIKDMIPSNWLDSLLTGPGAVVGKPPYNCKDIENILNAIRAKAPDAARQCLRSLGLLP
jgi:hypothetical protein